MQSIGKQTCAPTYARNNKLNSRHRKHTCRRNLDSTQTFPITVEISIYPSVLVSMLSMAVTMSTMLILIMIVIAMVLMLMIMVVVFMLIMLMFVSMIGTSMMLVHRTLLPNYTLFT